MLKTIEYTQPDFYHFSQTSIETAQLIAEKVIEYHLSKYHFIDLFAGCGVLSMETLARLPLLKEMQVDLIEMQSEFSNSLKENCHKFVQFMSGVNFYIAQENVLHWLKLAKISKDSIMVMNPPHFFKTEVLPASKELRNICQTIDEVLWREILEILLEKKVRTIFMQLRNESMLTQKTLEFFKNLKVEICSISGQECLLTLEFFNQ